MKRLPLPSFYVVPGYTFFYWGFTVPQQYAEDYKRFFSLGKGGQTRDVVLVIGTKRYASSIRMARLRSPKYPSRDVIQFCYPSNHETLKAIRKAFVFSYATTINKSKPKLKEVFEFRHVGANKFKITPIAKQQTDFDKMFAFMEDKNLFDYWKARRSKKPEKLFVDFSRKWHDKSELRKFENRVNVIYLLFNSKTQQLYVGKADRFRFRVKANQGRIGMPSWDQFMIFELDPSHSPYLEHIEAFGIAIAASILPNKVKISNLSKHKLSLVNKQMIL